MGNVSVSERTWDRLPTYLHADAIDAACRDVEFRRFPYRLGDFAKIVAEKAARAQASALR